MPQENAERSTFDRAVSDSSDLYRTSVGIASRWAQAYVNASATFWSEGGKALGEFIGEASEVVRSSTAKKDEKDGTEGEQTSGKGLSQLGSAFVKLTTRCGELYHSSLEKLAEEMSAAPPSARK